MMTRHLIHATTIRAAAIRVTGIRVTGIRAAGIIIALILLLVVTVRPVQAGEAQAQGPHWTTARCVQDGEEKHESKQKWQPADFHAQKAGQDGGDQTDE